MSINITLGSGVRSTKGWRVGLEPSEPVRDLVRVLNSRDPETESWFSGHLWQNDNRAKDKGTGRVMWEGMSCVVIDVDYYGSDVSKRHTEPPLEKIKKIRSSHIQCSFWYLTPRGARYVYVLDKTVSDPELAIKLIRGAAQFVNEHLYEEGLLACLDKDGKPFDGYRADVATNDLARIMYMHNAIVGEKPRFGEIKLVEPLPFNQKQLLAIAKSRAVDKTLSELLAEMPCEGENDGSMQLIRVASKAVRLGIMAPSRFIIEAKKWNERREVPWTAEQLEKRFTDAYTRWLETGQVLVPMSAAGKPMCTRDILHKILEEDTRWGQNLWFNEMSLQYMCGNEPLTDHMETAIEIEICRRYLFGSIPRGWIRSSFKQLASINAKHPVKEYLDSLPDHTGEDYIGDLFKRKIIQTTNDELSAVYLKKWMTGAVRRVLEPGCKMDNILLLIGRQGFYKSTFCNVLAGEFFSDTRLDLSSKDAYLVLRSAWIYEFSELEGYYRRSDVASIRSFLSSNVDTIRIPYDTAVQPWPRATAIIATANKIDVLQDPEGNRRFWAMEIERPIQIDMVRRMRDKLWTQAYAMAMMNETHYLSLEEDKRRAEQNEMYEPEDPMADEINIHIDRLLEKSNIIYLSDITKAMGYHTAVSYNIRNQIVRQLRDKGLRHSRLGTKRCWRLYDRDL